MVRLITSKPPSMHWWKSKRIRDWRRWRKSNVHPELLDGLRWHNRSMTALIDFAEFYWTYLNFKQPHYHNCTPTSCTHSHTINPYINSIVFCFEHAHYEGQQKSSLKWNGVCKGESKGSLAQWTITLVPIVVTIMQIIQFKLSMVG